MVPAVYSHVQGIAASYYDVLALVSVLDFCLPAPAFGFTGVAILQLLECEVWKSPHVMLQAASQSAKLSRRPRMELPGSA